MIRRIVATIAVTAAASVVSHADADRWWSHVKALADDSMEGRNTGSAGHKRAAEYVAAQFQKAGLEPAGIRQELLPLNQQQQHQQNAQQAQQTPPKPDTPVTLT